jgi:hypothetical protein
MCIGDWLTEKVTGMTVNPSDVNSAWNFSPTATGLAVGTLHMELSYRGNVMLYIYSKSLCCMLMLQEY